MKTGDLVSISYDGRTVAGVVTLASANGRSLVLEFEAVMGGYLGSMPVLMDDAGVYRDLRRREPVELVKR